MRELVGSWWLPDHEETKVAGTLLIEDQRHPHLRILGMRPEFSMLTDHEPTVPLSEIEIPAIHGEAVGVGAVSLLNCRDGGFHHRSAGGNSREFRIGLATLGHVWLDNDVDPWFRRIEVTVPALHWFFGDRVVSGYANSGWKLFGRNYAKVSLDSRTFRWKDSSERNSINTAWSMVPNGRLGRTGATVWLTPTVTFTSTQPKSLAFWLDDWIIPTLELISIATGEQVHAETVAGWPKVAPSSGPERDATKTEIVTRLSNSKASDESTAESSIVTAAQIEGQGMERLLAEVHRVKADHLVFTGLLTSFGSGSQRPKRNAYLDLTSGLEAYFAVAYPVTEEARAKHRQRRDAIIELVGADANAGDDLRKFAKTALRKTPDQSLESKLTRLLRKTKMVEGKAPIASTMAETRNRIAHGKPVESRTLDECLETAEQLSRLIFLDEVGLLHHQPSVEQDRS